MTNLPDPYGAAWQAEIERRLHALETSPRMPNTAQRGGTFTLLDDDGSERVKFGDFTDPDDNAGFGLQVYDEDQNTVLAASEDYSGLVYPNEHTQFIVPTTQPITSASFVAVAECLLWVINHEVIYVDAAVITPVGTTAEVRLSNSAGTLATSALTVGSGANGTARFTWLHPFTVGWSAGAAGSSPTSGTYSALLQYQVRRTSGTGDVTAYPPRSLVLASSRMIPGAASNGAPVFV